MSRRIASLVLSVVICLSVVLGSVLMLPGTAAAATPLWYLAEGSTAWGFGTYINIQNPSPAPVHIQMTYMTSTGPVAKPQFEMAPQSRATVNPLTDVGEKDFSTEVRCVEGSTIAVDRTMYWMGGPGSEVEQVMETHASVGAESAGTDWYMAEGSSAWGFETWVLVQNPNPVQANCTLRYMIEGFGPFDALKTVPPNSRASFSMADDIGSADASVRVHANVQVIAERAMYRNHRRMGHESIGTRFPSIDCYLAEGSTAWGFTTYLLIQNPNPAASMVNVRFRTNEGPAAMPAFILEPEMRRTIRVNDVLPNRDCSIYVNGSQPLVVERAMYWGGNSVWGEAGHDSIATAPATTWYMPGGDCGSLFETWTLVQNPNAADVQVQVDYMGEGGLAQYSFNATVPAFSRRSFNMTDNAALKGRYAVRVTSLTAGLSVICERATYVWTMAGSLSARTAGEGTAGVFE